MRFLMTICLVFTCFNPVRVIFALLSTNILLFIYPSPFSAKYRVEKENTTYLVVIIH